MTLTDSTSIALVLWKGPVPYTGYNYTTGYYNTIPNSAPLSNQTACIDGYVNGWNHVCDHKIARSWPNNEIICPMTFGRAYATLKILSISLSCFNHFHFDHFDICFPTLVMSSYDVCPLCP
ncbi:MAG: hypothetical protein WBF33_37505, partial [Candidatus Nitrosopolaris sp.]